MAIKHFFSPLLFCICTLTSLSWGASNYQSNSRSQQYPSPNEDLSAIVKQLRTQLSVVKNTVNNHETEVRTFENKLNAQEEVFEHTRQQLMEDYQSQQDVIKAFQLTVDSKLHSYDLAQKNLETLSKSTVADLRQFVSQSNETIQLFNQQQKKMVQLENIVEQQTQHIQQLEIALQSMMECLQLMNAKEASIKASQSGKSYVVQSGDSLEKIARLHQTTVKALREANPQINNDRIFQGQTLTIP